MQIIDQMAAAFRRGRRFLLHDVWHIEDPGEPEAAGFIIRQVRVLLLVARNLIRNDLTLRASALTFASALAVVPFLAIIFFIIQSFNADVAIYDYLNKVLEPHLQPSPEIQAETGYYPHGMPRVSPHASVLEPGGGPSSSRISKKLDFRQEFVDLIFRGVGQIDHTKDGKPLENPVKSIVEYAQQGANPRMIGVAGLVFVVTTVFGLMNNVESAFNTIWGVRRRRSWYRIFSDYLTITLLLPFVVAVVLSVTAILESEQVRAELGAFADGLRGLQYLLICTVFTAMYAAIPNTRVRLRYAAVGGVAGGLLWTMLSWAYVRFQVGLPNYSLFYSTFAQVPVLLMWVYFSWLILLLGAELSFAYQNEATFAMERLAAGASYAYREALGLWTMFELSRRFDEGLPALPPAVLAKAWHVPMRLLMETLDRLESNGLLVACQGNPPAFQPSRASSKIIVGEVLACFREAGREPSALRTTPPFAPLRKRLFQLSMASANETLASLIASSSDSLRQEYPEGDKR